MLRVGKLVNSIFSALPNQISKYNVNRLEGYRLKDACLKSVYLLVKLLVTAAQNVIFTGACVSVWLSTMSIS
jgi:hypothetical protein